MFGILKSALKNRLFNDYTEDISRGISAPLAGVIVNDRIETMGKYVNNVNFIAGGKVKL